MATQLGKALGDWPVTFANQREYFDKKMKELQEEEGYLTPEEENTLIKKWLFDGNASEEEKKDAETKLRKFLDYLKKKRELRDEYYEMGQISKKLRWVYSSMTHASGAPPITPPDNLLTKLLHDFTD